MISSGGDTKDFIFNKVPQVAKSLLKISLDAIRHPKITKLKAEEQFDLVAFGWFFNDYQLGLAAHFKCPSVIISTVPAMKIMRDYVGNPSGVSYTPAVFSPYTTNMTFPQRLVNFGLHTLEFVATNAFEYFISEPYYRELFPPEKYPSYSEAKKNVSLVLLNHHFTHGIPAANFPSMVEVGGLNLKFNTEPLSKVR